MHWNFLYVRKHSYSTDKNYENTVIDIQMSLICIVSKTNTFRSMFLLRIEGDIYTEVF